MRCIRLLSLCFKTDQFQALIQMGDSMQTQKAKMVSYKIKYF